MGQYHDIPPDRYAVCPVCRTPLDQGEGRGRKRKYCSDACKQAEFRNKNSKNLLRNSAETGRSDRIKEQLAVGDWRFNKLPAWPHYHCLACGQEIDSTSRLDIARQMVGPAWYDWKDYDQMRGVYRRVMCGECHDS